MAEFVDDTPTTLLPLDMAPELVAAAMPDPGSLLRSRYRLESIIGRGRTSTVFSAADLHLEVREGGPPAMVAIKILRSAEYSDPLASALLKREFQQMQSLLHPGITRVHELDCEYGLWFISMELVRGQTAHQWVQSDRSHAETLAIIHCCGEAVAHAHASGVLHGDLKPTNLLITDQGQAKLIDFGSAPGVGERAVAGSAAVVGMTPLYASPQVLSGQAAEQRDDVYSLACLSYFLFSGGRHPFGGHPSLENGRAKMAPDPIRALSAGLFAAIERGLSVESQQRQVSIREFLRDLDEGEQQTARNELAAAAGRGPAPKARVCARRRWRPTRDLRWSHPAVRLSGLLVLAVAVALIGSLSSRRQMPLILPELSAANLTPPVVSGEAPPPPVRSAPAVDAVSFVRAALHASAVQTMVALTVKRTDSAHRGSFLWRIESGSAQPGVDYGAVPPQLVQFHEGQSVRTLFVPLLHGAADSRRHGTRSFTVALEHVVGGPSLGRVARMTVLIDPSPDRLADYQARAIPAR